MAGSTLCGNTALRANTTTVSLIISSTIEIATGCYVGTASHSHTSTDVVGKEHVFVVNRRRPLPHTDRARVPIKPRRHRTYLPSALTTKEGVYAIAHCSR